jgi:hypothetical protein
MNSSCAIALNLEMGSEGGSSQQIYNEHPSGRIEEVFADSECFLRWRQVFADNFDVLLL